MKTPFFQTAAAVLLILALQAGASAHAFVDRAEPKVGSDVSPAPTDVKIWFTQRLEPTYCKIEVFDAAGKAIDKMDSHVDASDKRLLIVSVPQIPAGTYKVVWHVLSVDTHKTHGDFKFVVK